MCIQNTHTNHKGSVSSGITAGTVQSDPMKHLAARGSSGEVGGVNALALSRWRQRPEALVAANVSLAQSYV